MQATLKTKHPLMVDGNLIAAGTPVATIELREWVPIDNLVSGLYFGDIVAVIGAPAFSGVSNRPEPNDIKHVRRDPIEAAELDTALADDSELDADALNRLPDDDEPATNTSSEPAAELATVEQLSYPGLDGLPPRIAKALGDAGLVDRKQVADHRRENNGIDLDGIGKAAERKIIAWLEG
jgi:hypothetical protein